MKKDEFSIPQALPANLNSTFGMSEMEDAAMVILKKVIEKGKWNALLTIDDFSHDSYATTGFLNLLAFGWLKPSWKYNSAFVLRKRFVRRLMEKGKI